MATRLQCLSSFRRLCIVRLSAYFRASINLHNQEIRHLPESCSIGYLQCLYAIVILNFIRTGRVLAEQFGFLGMERNHRKRAFVGFSEIRHFIIALHDFRLAQEAAFYDFIVFKLLLRADYIVASVKLIGKACSFFLSKCLL